MAYITQTRGRKGYKNDNRFVEQRNSSLVRAYLDHLHLYTREHVALLNALYEEMWLYHNFFQPVLRQVERSAVLQANGICRIIRKHDVAKTPLQRLLQAKPPLSRTLAQRLQALYNDTNPLTLKRKIHQLLVVIYQVAARDKLQEVGLPR